MLCRHIDAACRLPHNLTGGTVCIFMARQKVCQIIVPQIPLEAMAYRHFNREQEITDFGKLLMSNCQYGDAYQTDIARSGMVDENE